MNEDSLIGAYNPPKAAVNLGVKRFHLGSLTYRPCHCGTWIGLEVEYVDWGPSMRLHQGTPAHRGWRARNGF